ncbi:MAG: hypothetical protein JO006_14130 [Paucibacter sp.]|nr:hypothetical protein [Roseateles sp.]
MNTRLALIPLALFATTAGAAPSDDLNRVEVSGQYQRLERNDVRHACPNIDTSLSDKLSGSWFREQPVGEMTVRFQLDGSNVSEVRTRGFPIQYDQTRQAVRRAVRELSCQADARGAQAYAFKIVFLAPEEDGAQRFVVNEIHLASQ